MSRDVCQDCKTLDVPEISRMVIDYIRAKRDGDINALHDITSRMGHVSEVRLFIFSMSDYAAMVPDEVLAKDLAWLDENHPLTC